MKKQFVVGTLLCTVMLNSIAIPAVTDVARAVTISEGIHSVKVKFSTDFGKARDLSVSGKIGEKIDISNKIPKGYTLAPGQSSQIMIDGNSSTVQVKLSANTRWDMIQFMGGKGVSASSIQKHTGELITINDYKKYVPAGYEIDTTKQTSFVSGNNNWGETFIVYIKKSTEPVKTSTMIHLDTDFGKVKSVQIDGIHGEKSTISHLVPKGYSLAKYQSDFIVHDVNKEEVRVRLSSIEHYVTIQFNTGSGFSMRAIKKHTGEKITLADYKKYIPAGYEVVNPQAEFVATHRNDTFIVNLKKSNKPVSKVTNILKFVDQHGKTVDEKQVSGDLGSKITLIPGKNYTINQFPRYTLEKSGTVSTIKVSSRNIVNFTRADGFVVKSILVDMDKEGHPVYSDTEIPTGYGVSRIKYEYDQFGSKIFVIEVRKILVNKIRFIDPHGRNVFEKELRGYRGEKIKLTAPEGYTLIDEDVLGTHEISDEHQIHNILVDKLFDEEIDSGQKEPEKKKSIIHKIISLIIKIHGLVKHLTGRLI